MKSFGIFAAAAVFATSAFAADGGWRIDSSGPVTTARLSSTGDVSFALACRRGGGLWLELDGLGAAGWIANVPVSLEIGGRSFPMIIAGGSDGVLLTDVPGNGFRLSSDLVAALRATREVVVGGPAVARMATGARRFSTRGMGDVLARLARACGEFRDAPVEATPKATTTSRAEGPLDAEGVRTLLVGKRLDHVVGGQNWPYRYGTDGSFSGRPAGTAISGRYRIEPDGKLCWEGPNARKGCFRYVVEGGAIRVKNGAIGSDIGPVIIRD